MAASSRELRDWAQSFVFGRLAGLMATFCAAPFLLVSPGATREGLPVLAAALAINLLGLMMARVVAHPMVAILASYFGVVFLGIGGFGDLSFTLPVLAAVALLLELLTAPGDRRGLVAVVPAMVLLLAGGATFAGPEEGIVQSLMGALLLPLSAMVSLHAQLGAMRARATADAMRATTAADRERVMLAAADAAVLVAERSGHIVDGTERSAQLLGVTAEVLQGRGFIDRVLIADRPALLKAISDACQDGATTDLTLRLAVHGEGAPSFAQFSLNVRPAAGLPGRAGLRIAAALPWNEKSRGGTERSALFAALSHEIRTPMNAILGFSELLSTPGLVPRDPAKIAEYADIIRNSARESFAVTCALVDLLRVETTPFSADSDVDAEEMVRTVLKEVAGRAPGGAVSVQISGALAAVMVDRRALRMLLNALMDGLTTACGGRASIDCTMGSTGLRPLLELVVLPTGKAPTGERSAFLGVLRELSQRLADAMDASLEIETYAAGWRVSLRFAAPVSTFPAAKPARIVPTASVQSLRKSA